MWGPVLRAVSITVLFGVFPIISGTALMWGPVLRAVPIAVLFGVFLSFQVLR